MKKIMYQQHVNKHKNIITGKYIKLHEERLI